MAMGKRKSRQEELFVFAEGLPKSAGHPFYKKLNELLAEAEFDRWIERRCQQYYEQEDPRGRPSTPPGVYFRMLLVGYFENIDSQRGIAWRCAAHGVFQNRNAAHSARDYFRSALCVCHIIRRGDRDPVYRRAGTAHAATPDVCWHPRTNQPHDYRSGKRADRVLDGLAGDSRAAAPPGRASARN